MSLVYIELHNFPKSCSQRFNAAFNCFPIDPSSAQTGGTLMIDGQQFPDGFITVPFRGSFQRSFARSFCFAHCPAVARGAQHSPLQFGAVSADSPRTYRGSIGPRKSNLECRYPGRSRELHRSPRTDDQRNSPERGETEIVFEWHENTRRHS